MSRNFDISQVFAFASDLPRNLVRKLPQRTPSSWLQFREDLLYKSTPIIEVPEVVAVSPGSAQLIVPLEISHHDQSSSRRIPSGLQSQLQQPGWTQPQGIVWTGLSALSQVACLMLWTFCLRTYLRSHDISALHPHTLKGFLVALGTLLFIVFTFAAYLRSIRLRFNGPHRLPSRGTILLSAQPPLSTPNHDSRPMKSADMCNGGGLSPVETIIPSSPSPSSSPDSSQVGFAEQCFTNTTSCPSETIQPCSSSGSSTVEIIDKYTITQSPREGRWRRATRCTFAPGPPETISPASPAPSSRDSILVMFAVKYTTIPGENMVIVGSSIELGAWDISRSVVMEWTHGNIWVAKVELARGVHRVEYKYVVRSDRTTLWESGSNHVFEARKVKVGVPPYRLDVWGRA